jgi:hypothetical protein
MAKETYFQRKNPAVSISRDDPVVILS